MAKQTYKQRVEDLETAMGKAAEAIALMTDKLVAQDRAIDTLLGILGRVVDRQDTDAKGPQLKIVR